MPFGIGAPELIIVLVIILILFGVGRLPEIGGALGRGIREFRKGANEVDKAAKDIQKPLKTEPDNGQKSGPHIPE
ncbi:MAG: twin-arginine translocase TatA/TatE family subunit [Dehalococcoidia bacterium]